MPLLRGKLLAGALFAGTLFGPQPVDASPGGGHWVHRKAPQTQVQQVQQVKEPVSVALYEEEDDMLLHLIITSVTRGLL